MRLEGKTAIVTGAGSGFGEGIARRFAEEGARVLVADVNEAAARSVAAQLPGAVAFRADVSREADVAAMIEAAVGHFGPLDILVNNAGVGHLPQQLEHLPEAEFDRLWAVNVKAIYFAAKHAVPAMKARRMGANPQHRLHRRGQSPAQPHLVQRHEGLGDHRHSGHGRRACPTQRPGQCAQPGRRRDAPAGHLHGWRHAANA